MTSTNKDRTNEITANLLFILTYINYQFLILLKLCPHLRSVATKTLTVIQTSDAHARPVINTSQLYKPYIKPIFLIKMVNIKIPLHNRNLKKRLETLKSWKINEADKEDIKRFIEELGLGKVNRGKQITDSRKLRYLDLLKVPLEYFKKSVSELLENDIEKLERDLSSDKIRSFFKNKPYSPETKSSLKRALKIYIKWKLKEEAHKLISWLDLRTPKRTPDFLSENEVEKLYRACTSTEMRFLIAVLFDSGARAEEFHNIRFEDFIFPEGKNNFVKIALKDEYSKTNGRTIGLYWKYSTSAVIDYIEERKKEGIKLNEPVFKNKYDNVRYILHRLGKKVLDRKVNYHLFRHSSATYYAPKLNRQELCYRYGWTFSSDMPDVYISRSGEFEKQVNEKFTNTELEELKRQIIEQEQKNKILLNEQTKMKDEIKQIREMNRKVMERLQSLKT